MKYQTTAEAFSVLFQTPESKVETVETGISKTGEPNGQIGKLVEEIGKELGGGIGRLDEKMVRKFREKFEAFDKKMDTRFKDMGIKHSSESKELSEMTQFYGVCSELPRTGEAANLSSGRVCLHPRHPHSGMAAMSCIIYRMFQ